MALVRALERWRGLADTMSRHTSEMQKAARKRADLTARAATLGSFVGTLEELVALRLPAEGALDHLATRAAELDKSLSRCADRVSELEGKLLAVEQQLAEATGDFAPPTKSELERARRERDEAWGRVRLARGSSTEPAALAELDSAFERAAREADVVADRMILEADRVTTLARLRARQATESQQHCAMVAERARLERDRAAIEDEHRAAWNEASAASITPRGLAEMRAWHQKHAAIVEAFGALREAELDVEDTRARLASARGELSSALEISGNAANVDLVDLVDLVDRATERLARIEGARRAGEEASRGVAKLEAQIDDRNAELLRDEALLASARAGLSELVGPLGVADDASAEEVTRALEALRELFTLEDQRASAAARAASALEEARAFDDEAATVAADLASDLTGLPARDVATALADRAAAARAAESKLVEIDAELAPIVDERVDPDVLLMAADPHAAAQALEALDARLGELDRDILSATRGMGSIENGLTAMGVESGASEAAARAQEALERVRVQVERFARAKIGAVILAREIERYRQENQGPMLTSASKMFARLTLGRFTGVRAGYDDKDKPTIKCVRAGNINMEGEVDVEGLSEGTRDQLYLSLRLASLLRYADLAEPMPLVLDDVLVQFDDERSRAALELIAELSGRMQVLFFTHHTRLVELARSTVPAASLTVHELSSPARLAGATVAPA
jgi:uncharacterized protein YhaN